MMCLLMLRRLFFGKASNNVLDARTAKNNLSHDVDATRTTFYTK